MSEQALALVPRNSVLPSSRDWETMLNMADTLFKSGVLPEHIKNGAAVVAIMQKGKELGIQPMHALQNIAFIKGKTTLQAELMLALVIREEGAGALRVAKTDNTGCTVAYRRAGNEGEYTFTIEDARAAGLVQAGGMYTKYPAAMLRSRCISAVCRFVFPDIIGGMYLHEEMGATVDEDGSVLAFPDEKPLRATLAQESHPPEQPADRTGLTNRQKALWVAAKRYYGKDEASDNLHKWIGLDYPAATNDEGKPSIRALLDAQCDAMIEMMESADDSDAEPAPDEAHLKAIQTEIPTDDGR